MRLLTQTQTRCGVGRLHRGYRNLGCVGYSLEVVSGPATVIRFDPMPDAAAGDVFHLTLEDGLILECQVMNESVTYCAVLEGPRVERRHRRRPAPIARVLF